MNGVEQIQIDLHKRAVEEALNVQYAVSMLRKAESDTVLWTERLATAQEDLRKAEVALIELLHPRLAGHVKI